MAEPTEWGIPLVQPPRQFMDLLRPKQGAIPVRHKPGGRIAGPEGQDDAARLRKAARDFEAVFLYQIVKQMRRTVHREKMFYGGIGEDVFSDMMDEEIAKKMAGRGCTGIADMIFRQLSRQYGIREAKKGRAGAGLPDLSGSAEALHGRLRSLQGKMKAADAAGPLRTKGR